MSRTYRKPGIVRQYENEIAWVNRNGWNHLVDYSTRLQRVRKSKEEYEAQVAEANRRYEEQIANLPVDSDGVPYDGYRRYLDWWTKEVKRVKCYVRKPHVSKYKHIEVPWSYEQYVEEEKSRYARYHRDWRGHHSYKTEKNIANRKIRRKAKKYCHDVMHDDYDGKPQPLPKKGKSWWW